MGLFVITVPSNVLVLMGANMLYKEGLLNDEMDAIVARKLSLFIH